MNDDYFFLFDSSLFRPTFCESQIDPSGWILKYVHHELNSKNIKHCTLPNYNIYLKSLKFKTDLLVVFEWFIATFLGKCKFKYINIQENKIILLPMNNVRVMNYLRRRLRTSVGWYLRWKLMPKCDINSFSVFFDV